MMSILINIDAFLRRTGMAPTRFGRESVRDPRLVFDIRRGRTLTPETTKRVMDFMAGYRG